MTQTEMKFSDKPYKITSGTYNTSDYRYEGVYDLRNALVKKIASLGGNITAEDLDNGDWIYKRKWNGSNGKKYELHYYPET